MTMMTVAKPRAGEMARMHKNNKKKSKTIAGSEACSKATHYIWILGKEWNSGPTNRYHTIVLVFGVSFLL